MSDDLTSLQVTQCPSWAAALGYMGVAAAVCLSNWGSAVCFICIFGLIWVNTGNLLIDATTHQQQRSRTRSGKKPSLEVALLLGLGLRRFMNGILPVVTKFFTSPIVFRLVDDQHALQTISLSHDIYNFSLLSFAFSFRWVRGKVESVLFILEFDIRRQ
jgi:hypothetical protein